MGLQISILQFYPVIYERWFNLNIFVLVPWWTAALYQHLPVTLHCLGVARRQDPTARFKMQTFFFSQSGGCQLGSKRKSKGLPKCHVISFQYFFFPFPCETFLYSLFCWYGPRFVRLSCARFSLDIGRCSSKKDIYHNFLLCMLFIQVQTYLQDFFCVQGGK